MGKKTESVAAPLPATPEALTPSVPIADLAAEAAAIVATAPEPQEHAINASQESSQAPLPSGGSHQPVAAVSAQGTTAEPYQYDDKGVIWDASKHAVGKDGKGVRTAKGDWRAKRQSRVGTPPRVAASGTVAGVTHFSQAQAFDPNRARLSGVMCARASNQMMGMFGAHWRPDADESRATEQAMGDYFVAKGMQDFPPGVALVMVYTAFLGRRLSSEPAKKQMSGLRLRFAAWMIRRRLKKQGITAKVEIRGNEILVDGEVEASLS